MVLNIIMALSIYPIFFIMYFILRANAKPQKGRYFSVSLKHEWTEEEETKRKIEEVNRQYQKELKWAFLISVLVPVICFVVPYVSIQCTIWIVWIFAAIAIYYAPFVRANKTLRQWKESKGFGAQANPQIYVELKSAGQVRCVSAKQYLLPFMLTALTFVSGLIFRTSGRAQTANPSHEIVFYTFLISFLLCIALFAVCAISLDKKAAEVISQDSDVNLNYARAKKMAYRGFWEAAAWLTVGMQVLTAVFLWFEDLFFVFVLAGTILYSVLAILRGMLLAKKLARVEAAYRDKWEDELFADDDRYWIGGILYYNPRDKRTMIETRIGMGTTYNAATPIGKVMNMIGAAAVLASVLLCGWLILEEFTPITLTADSEAVCARHLKPEYEIAVDEIKEITCMSELPKMSKTVGSAMDTLYKGKFYISKEKTNCQVFLNPQNELFLKIVTEDAIYYLSGVNDAQTQAVYDIIQGRE